MKIGAIICFILAVFFFVMAILFALLKEKGALLISGFKTMPKSEREKYDKTKMSKEMRNALFLWFLILLSGTVLAYLIGEYCAYIALAVWLIVFFKGMHLDPEKAFKKYKK